MRVVLEEGKRKCTHKSMKEVCRFLIGSNAGVYIMFECICGRIERIVEGERS